MLAFGSHSGGKPCFPRATPFFLERGETPGSPPSSTLIDQKRLVYEYGRTRPQGRRRRRLAARGAAPRARGEGVRDDPATAGGARGRRGGGLARAGRRARRGVPPVGLRGR